MRRAIVTLCFLVLASSGPLDAGSTELGSTSTLLAPGNVRVSPGTPSDFEFEERVHVQEAIERAYYSHQVGAEKPFDEAVPRALIEEKVRTYLKQSLALERYWNTPVTGEMLRRELQRIADGTQFPSRLHELYDALDNDPFLIEECLARATLVSRLTRNFYAHDERMHVKQRQRAETLVELATGPPIRTRSMRNVAG